MANPAQDPISQRLSAIQAQIANLSKVTPNPSQQLRTELASLAYAVGNVSKWLSKTTEADSLRASVFDALEGSLRVLDEVEQVPAHGPGLTEGADKLRPKLAAIVVYFLFLGVNATQKGDDEIAAMGSKMNAVLAAQKKEYDEVLAMAQIARHMAEGASEKAIEASKTVGITVQMKAFAEARDDDRWWSYVWAILTAFVAAILIGCAVYEINKGSGPPDAKGSWYVAGNLSHYLARGLGVSLVSYLLVFCTKNFRAAKHNQVVNGHRASALATVDTLRTPNNKELDAAIMLHVADAVFTPQPTGYDENDSSGTHMTELAAPLIKKLTGAGE